MRSASNIAILIPEFPGQTHIFFWREIQALRASGHSVKIVSTRKPKANNFHEFCSEIDDTYYLASIPYFQVFKFLLLNLSWIFAALGYCFRLDGGVNTKLRACLFIPVAANLAIYCRKYEIDHIHVHSSADAAHIVALGQLLRIFTYSVCIHGNLNQYGSNHSAKLSSASFLVTVTKPLREEIRSHLPDYPIENVHVLPMGVDIGKFLARTYAKRRGNPCIITSVSRLAYVKGHSYALQALAELPNDFEFLYQIVGDGDMRQQLESQVESLGLESKVQFLGFQKEGEVYKILQNTDVFMLTSFGFGEAAPVAIMEAMACGVAPICSIIGGTRDMICDTHDGLLVNQKDVQDIKRALTYLLEDYDRLVAIGRNARVTAESKFCHRRSAGTLLRYIVNY